MLSRFSLAVSWSLFSIALSQAALLTRVADIPTNVVFDFIIVGGKDDSNGHDDILTAWNLRWYRRQRRCK